LDGGIAGRIKPNGTVRTRKVIVNGPRYADGRNTTLLIEQMGTRQGTIPTNHYHCLNAMFLQVFKSLFSSFRGFEFITPCGFKKSAPPFQNISHILCFEPLYIVEDQSLKA